MQQLWLPYVGPSPRAQRAINAVVKAEAAVFAEAARFAAAQDAKDDARSRAELQFDLACSRSVKAELLRGEL